MLRKRKDKAWTGLPARVRSLKSPPLAANPFEDAARGRDPFWPQKRLLETTSEQRKMYPITTGLLDYFPDACAAIAEVSYLGNQKHNPGQPMHHARGKSNDHADCIARHLVERGGFDGKIRHSAALAWRACCLLQEELEREKGLSLPRGARDEITAAVKKP
jgi:hypothetical protein